ncbi:glycerol-3-phosphate dehydrogenase/oxidase, partial [candidate division KSB1 bacterium]
MKRNPNELTDREFDVIIVGGGIYGATIAWDAVLRGFSVALIEKDDFGGNTSSNSLKIVHGGLRYLQQLDIKRVRESVRERRIMLTIAPHLVQPLSCLMPTYGHFIKGPEVMFCGMLLNDILSADRNIGVDPLRKIPNCRIIS